MPSDHMTAFVTLDDGNIMNAADLWVRNQTLAEVEYGLVEVWDTSRVTSMNCLWSGAEYSCGGEWFLKRNFDGNISFWDVSRVTSMYNSFDTAASFNGDITSWDMSSVSDMEYMFYEARSFNRDISSWDVSSATTMRGMFYNANSFNVNISAWDVSLVTDMLLLFYGSPAGSISLCGQTWFDNQVAKNENTVTVEAERRKICYFGPCDVSQHWEYVANAVGPGSCTDTLRVHESCKVEIDIRYGRYCTESSCVPDINPALSNVANMLRPGTCLPYPLLSWRVLLAAAVGWLATLSALFRFVRRWRDSSAALESKSNPHGATAESSPTLRAMPPVNKREQHSLIEGREASRRVVGDDNEKVDLLAIQSVSGRGAAKPSRWTFLKAQLVQGVTFEKIFIWPQLVLVTGTMALLDTASTVMGAVCLFAAFSLGSFAVHETFGLVGLALFMTSLVLLVLVVFRTAQRIDEMESFVKDFEKADIEVGLKERECREKQGNGEVLLGPFPRPLSDAEYLTMDFLDGDAYASLDHMFERAEELKLPFQTEVIKPLAAVCSHVTLWSRLKKGDVNASLPVTEVATQTNMKGRERAEEKTMTEYGGNFIFLKDLVRCSILCDGLDEVGTVWESLQELQRQEVVSIIQIKNRFRGRPLTGGYRDININVIFEGLVCEVQIHSIVHFEIKKKLHPLYKFCRSYELVGDFNNPHNTNWEKLRAKNAAEKSSNGRCPPVFASSIILGVRCAASFWGMFQFLGYLYFGLLDDMSPYVFNVGIFGAEKLVVEPPFPFATMKVFALAAPYLAATSMILTDTVGDRVLHGCALIGMATVSIAVVFANDNPIWLWLYWGTLLVLYFIVLVAGAEPNVSPRRISLLYARYFGMLHGSLFAHKTALLQFVAVLLQAQGKLLLLGEQAADISSKTAFWVYLFLLIINSCLPPYLLAREEFEFQRLYMGIIDICLDLAYLLTFALLGLATYQAPDLLLPTGLIEYFSNLFPVLRIVSVCRGLETCRSVVQATAPSHQRLPLPWSFLLGFVSLLSVLVIVLTNREAYPFEPTKCAPCLCVGGLLDCSGPIARAILAGKTSFELQNVGIISVKAGAFRGYNGLRTLDLQNNAIESLQPGAFDGLVRVEQLWLNGNAIESLQPGAFDGLVRVEQLWLNGNPLSVSSENYDLTDMVNLQDLLVFNTLTDCTGFELPAFSACRDDSGDVLDLSGLELRSLYASMFKGMHSLQTLNLSNNQLTSIPLGSFEDLLSLKALSLVNNEFAGSVSPELGRLMSLQLLDLSNNYLTGSLPDFLWNLKNMRVLRLDGNRFSGSIPAELGQLTQLQILDLNYNELTGSIPRELCTLQEMTRMYFRENQLTGSIPAEIGQLGKLEEFFVSKNQLAGTLPKELGQLGVMRSLLFNENQFSGSIPKQFGNLTKLDFLYLDSNKLSGSIPAEMGNLDGLESLNLDGNQLSGSIPPELGSMESLVYLYLGSNEISGVESLAESLVGRSLLYLHLPNNSISDEGALALSRAVAALPSIVFFNLEGNPISQEAKEEIRALVPFVTL